MKMIGRIIIFVIAGIILVSTFWFLWEDSLPETMTYEIITPIPGNVESSTTVTGNIEPRNETAVKPEIPGTIKTILKEVGQNVTEGEIIAILNIIPDAGQLNAAESRLRVADINMEEVSKKYQRQRMLYSNDVISKNDFEIIEAMYYKALEEQENAKDALEIVKTGRTKTSSRINNTLIRASSSGVILEIPVKIGNKVIPSNPFNEGTTIATVADMNDLIFKGTIDESEVGKIYEGMPVSISVGAIPNETIDAVLEYIAPKGKKESGTVLYEIKAAIKMPKTTLIRAMYSANAKIILQQASDVIKIPESAIEFDNNGLTYVFVLKNGKSKNQTFIRKQIEIGISDGNNVEVLSGLSVTDKIKGANIISKSK